MLVAGALGLLALSPLATGRPTARPAHALTGCSGGFTATVLHGPDALLALSGNLHANVAGDGAVTGLLAVHGSRRVHVTGRVSGHTLHLRFKLASGVISGTGTAGHAITSCLGMPTSGTLAGPRSGDSGDWNYCDRHPDTPGSDIPPMWPPK